jgi:hypothetical protein
VVKYWEDLDAQHFWNALDDTLEQQDARTDGGKEENKENRPAQ